MIRNTHTHTNTLWLGYFDWNLLSFLSFFLLVFVFYFEIKMLYLWFNNNNEWYPMNVVSAEFNCILQTRKKTRCQFRASYNASSSWEAKMRNTLFTHPWISQERIGNNFWSQDLYVFPWKNLKNCISLRIILPNNESNCVQIMSLEWSVDGVEYGKVIAKTMAKAISSVIKSQAL